MYGAKIRGQQKWQWDHAFYLFLGGVAGATYVIAIIASHLGIEWISCYKTAMALSFPAAILSVPILSAGLGAPMKAINSWRKSKTSWIARGVLIWTVFLVACFLTFITFILELWPWQVLHSRSGLPIGAWYVIPTIGLIFGLGVMIYTGYLLAAARPVVFWSSGSLPALFFVFSLVSGLLAVTAALAIFGVREGRVLRPLQYGALTALIAQFLLVVFQLNSSMRASEGRDAVELLVKGKHSLLFWLGTIVIGHIIPIIVYLLVVVSKFTATNYVVAQLGSICGLAEALCSRQAVLRVGVFARLTAGRFEYVITNP